MKKIPFILRLVQGAIGKRFVVKHYKSGKIIITRYPYMKGIIPSAAQKHRRRLFKKAVKYAQMVYQNPALLKEKRRMLRRPPRLFGALIKEWFRLRKEKESWRERRCTRWRTAYRQNSWTKTLPLHKSMATHLIPEMVISTATKAFLRE